MNLNAWIRDVSKDMFTGLDGQSTDIGRVVGALGFITMLGIGVAEEARASPNYPFSFQDFGIGLGAYLTAWGALLKLKENSEPKPTNSQQ